MSLLGSTPSRTGVVLVFFFAIPAFSNPVCIYCEFPWEKKNWVVDIVFFFGSPRNRKDVNSVNSRHSFSIAAPLPQSVNCSLPTDPPNLLCVNELLFTAALKKSCFDTLILMGFKFLISHSVYFHPLVWF